MSVKALFYDWGGWNLALFKAINLHASDFAGSVAAIGNVAGNYAAMPVLAGMLLLFAAIASRRHQHDTAANLRWQVRCLIVAFLLAWCVVVTLKLGFDYPRPLAVLGAEVQVVGMPSDRYSFPSGHTSYAALVMAVLWSLFRPVYRGLLLVFLVWVGWSRIVSGAHFPADVVAGAFIGMLSGWLAIRLVLRLPGNGNDATSKIAFRRLLVQAKLAFSAGNLDRSVVFLQRAHIAGQLIIGPHLMAHLWMLRVAIVRADWVEIRGQCVRIALVPVGHLLGRLPAGNPGNASVNAFKPLSGPHEVRPILEEQYDK